MSTTAIVLIVIGLLIVLALLYFATRGSEKAKAKRHEKRHRQAELGRAAERERHQAAAHKARARAARADEERKAHAHDGRAVALEREAGKRGRKRK